MEKSFKLGKCFNVFVFQCSFSCVQEEIHDLDVISVVDIVYI